jgi:hypothetical protein
VAKIGEEIAFPMKNFVVKFVTCIGVFGEKRAKNQENSLTKI